jgi:ABC-2 type transport system ATP-binding protein
VTLGDCVECDLSSYGTLIAQEDKTLVQVKAEETAAITARILADLPVVDLTIQDPPIEDVIGRAFHE